MANPIDARRFTSEFFDLLDETFENHHGIYLDRGTSLFETLAGINAAEASRPVGGRCASIAAQVAHVTFYLEVLERYIQTNDAGDVDWGEIWRTVGAVSPERWAALTRQLEGTYRRIQGLLLSLDDWNGETNLSSALAILVHTAYHLGEIRQALCTVKGSGPEGEPTPAAANRLTPHHFLGAWELDPSQSDYQVGQPPKRGRLTFNYDGRHLRYSMEWTTQDDQEMNLTLEVIPDGQDHAYDGNPTLADATRYLMIDEYTLDSEAKKGGAVVAYARRVISADGQTMAIVQSGRTPDGASFDNRSVYRRA